MSDGLAQRKCQSCEGIGKPLAADEARNYLTNLDGWQIDETGKTLGRTLNMKNFLAAVEFINEIAKIAEAENHHPDFHLTNYRKLRIDLSTHAIGGLSENDFILAAKINQLPAKLKA